MNEFSQRIAALSPEQRALFELRLKKKGLKALQTQSIPKRKEANGLPLSFAQQRMWFLDQLEPGNPFYNIAAIVRFEGELNVAVLEQTLSEIVRRHETLRTTFPTANGQPIQVITSPQPLTIPIVDLTALPETQQEAEVQRLSVEQMQQPFNLAQGSLDLLHKSEKAKALRGVTLAFADKNSDFTDKSGRKCFAPTAESTFARDSMNTSTQQKHESLLPILPTPDSRLPTFKIGLLLRVTLLQLSPTQHVMLYTVPHILSDAWSSGVLVREVAALYDAFSKGYVSPLPELPIQYADFAIWQRQWLQGEVLETQLGYWKQQLGGKLPVLQLPTDRPRPLVPTFQGAWQPFTLPKALTEALQTLSKREGVTPFMLLLTAFKILLYRYTGQEDILVGSPIANRNRPEIEGLIGCFVNMLVLRTNLSGNPSFRELLHRVREMTLGAYAHQDLPFERLVEELQPERYLNFNPLFQVTFALQNTPALSLELPDLTLNLQEIGSQTTKFDLTLNLSETPDGLSGIVEYSTDLFDAATITRIIGHFQTLLEGIVANPDRPISDIPLLSEAERHQLLVARNQTHTNYPQDTCLHQWFEAQVERSPDAVAVVFEDEQLTYRQLNRRANQIAHYLKSLGVGPEQLVGLCVERSLELVVGVLGILKAGGAYVPIDPAYPQDRLAFVLQDAQVSLLLTQEHLLEKLSEHQVPMACLDTDAFAQYSQENPPRWATPDNLAYVIYTSGSTGKPKGVLVNHANVVRLFQSTESWFHFNKWDVWTLFHSIAFDFSVWELWGALLYGGRLVVVPYWVSRSPEDFYKLLSTQQVTVLNQTPSAFRQLIRVEETAETPNDLTNLRLVIFGGEALDLQSLQPWFERHGDRSQLVNMYGITETTVHVTYRPLSIADLNAGLGSAIGCPIPDLQVYILDPHQQLVPIGVPGEMYVGGAGVAKGYLNRPQLTAERFIANPFKQEGEGERGRVGEGEKGRIVPLCSERLYKTGDLGRYLPNGDIEYLGRIDQQVKIRGFRIELGEIEAALMGSPDVQEAVVAVREDEPGHKRLVAYVVPSPHCQESSQLSPQLRTYLQEKLPEYFIPSAFVILDALPLTPSGKVDRRSLPDPDPTRPDLESTFEAPRTPIEAALAEIWAQVLGLDRVGIRDNFFELGGDSILSMQIVAKANQVGLRLASPRLLFERQTIARLATVVEATPTLPTEQETVCGELPLTPIQHWFFEREFLDAHHWNQALHLEVRQCIDPAVLEQAVRHLTQHHDALRLRFIEEQSGIRQCYADSDTGVPLTQIDLSEIAQTEHSAALEAAATKLQTSLNLLEGPLWRVALINLGANRPHRLLIIIHHLAVDGVSWRILLEDLQTAYQQLSRGEAIELPSKTTSYKQWAEQLRDYARSPDLQRELEYWLAEPEPPISSRAHLAGGEEITPSAPPVLTKAPAPAFSLPVDYPEGDNAIANASTLSVTLNAEETQALLQEVPSAYSTQINDVLLTALVQAFARWTGEARLLVNLEGHGREDIFDNVNLSRTVGWFTTIFPVLLEIPTPPQPGEALKSVKEQLRRIPNRGIGYGILRYLHENRDVTEPLRVRPHAEVVFNYLGQLDRTLSESSLFKLTQESVGSERSPRGMRPYLLEINGFVAGGQLRLDWTYSQAVHQQTTIRSLAEDFLEALRSLIAHCLSPDAGGYTPSDFPDVDLKREQLDKVLEEMGLG